MKIHMIGGLGDVALSRKYKTIFDKGHELKSIVDVYDPFSVAFDFDDLMENISSKRLKGKLDSRIKNRIKNDLEEEETYYFSFDNKEVLSDDFLENIEEGDVVDISSPNVSHFPFLQQLIYKTKAHILVEKPVVSSFQQARDLKDQLGYTNLENRVLMNAEHYAYYENVMEYRENFENYFNRFGKIKGVTLSIEECEDFSSGRNLDILDKEKAGGGMLLDLGVHTFAFLRSIGADINYNSLYAELHKFDDPKIKGGEYGETSAWFSFYIKPNEFFDKECLAKARVGKYFEGNKKKFTLMYDDGKVEVDIGNKTLKAFRNINGQDFEVETHYFENDAYVGVYDQLERAVLNGEEPVTTLKKGLKDVQDVFITYSRAEPLKEINQRLMFDLEETTHKEEEIIPLMDESGFTSGAGYFR